jgi:hypothetical protein
MALVRYHIQVTGVTSCNMLTCPCYDHLKVSDRCGHMTDVEGIIYVTAQNVLADFHRYRSGSLAIQILTGVSRTQIAAFTAKHDRRLGLQCRAVSPRRISRVFCAVRTLQIVGSRCHGIKKPLALKESRVFVVLMLDYLTRMALTSPRIVLPDGSEFKPYSDSDQYG